MLVRPTYFHLYTRMDTDSSLLIIILVFSFLQHNHNDGLRHSRTECFDSITEGTINRNRITTIPYLDEEIFYTSSNK